MPPLTRLAWIRFRRRCSALSATAGVVVRIVLSPLRGLRRWPHQFPRLTPRAAFLRRFAAGRQNGFHHVFPSTVSTVCFQRLKGVPGFCGRGNEVKDLARLLRQKTKAPLCSGKATEWGERGGRRSVGAAASEGDGVRSDGGIVGFGEGGGKGSSRVGCERD
jgi:hypothetical protein